MDAKDRLRGELDYAVSCRVESEIQGLTRHINPLGAKIENVEKSLRQRVPQRQRRVHGVCSLNMLV